MHQVFEYYNRVQGMRGSLLGLPAWARFVLLLVALPGVAAVALSILAVLCSLAALLLVTVPVYRLLRLLTGHGHAETQTWAVESPEGENPARRHVDVKIIESTDH